MSEHNVKKSLNIKNFERNTQYKIKTQHFSHEIQCLRNKYTQLTFLNMYC